MEIFLTSFVLTLIGTTSAASLILSVISLLIHWKRPKVHPDTTRVQGEIEALRANHLELLDRVEHWIKRDRVRKLRSSNEEKATGPSTGDDEPQTPAERKNALRRRVMGTMALVPGRKATNEGE